MPERIEKQIGNHLHLVRELLLLTIKAVSSFTEIPITTLRRIENGLISSDSKYTKKLCDFYGIEVEDLHDLDELTPDWKTLRRKALAKHKANIGITNALNERPLPKKAIQYRVLESSFLNNFGTTKVIREHLITRYRWTYSYQAILVALDSLIEDGIIETKGKDVRPQEYRKARIISNVKHIVIDQISMHLEEITPQDIKDLHSPAYKKSAGMLLSLREGSKKRSEIFSSVNYGNLAENQDRSLTVLSKLNLVEMTIKDKPNSSLQRYRLTQKGEELVDKFYTI